MAAHWFTTAEPALTTAALLVLDTALPFMTRSAAGSLLLALCCWLLATGKGLLSMQAALAMLEHLGRIVVVVFAGQRVLRQILIEFGVAPVEKWAHL